MRLAAAAVYFRKVSTSYIRLLIEIQDVFHGYNELCILFRRNTPVGIQMRPYVIVPEYTADCCSADWFFKYDIQLLFQ